MNNRPTISAYLVVYNEEPVIERCLKSIRDIVDEIIVVHDGECGDKTLEIAQKYGARIFVEPHIGIAEPHRSMALKEATGEWILQVDADEFLDEAGRVAVRGLVSDPHVDGYYFNWELWDGAQPVHFPGLQKLVLFKKSAASFQGVPQTEVAIQGVKKKVDVVLHHQPVQENISWRNANRKRVYWLKAHVPYFFQ